MEPSGYEQVKLPSSCFWAQRAYRSIAESFLIVQEKEGGWQKKDAQQLLMQLDADILFVIGASADVCFIRCMSRTEKVRALEMVDFMLEQYGIAKGDAKWAQGSVSQVILMVCMSEQEITDQLLYFMYRAEQYFQTSRVVWANSFETNEKELFEAMRPYRKKQVSWAYVRTTEIADAGTFLNVRTLENDTGVMIRADENTYVMIGCLGEVYAIDREKFEASYVPSTEKLDIFTNLLSFIPSVERVDGGIYLTIDEVAHLCYPKQGAGIMAAELAERTKVFCKNRTDYFIGNPGDYLAMRCEDYQDIYVIRK